MAWPFHTAWQPTNLLFLQMHYYAFLGYVRNCGLKMLLEFYVSAPGLCWKIQMLFVACGSHCSLQMVIWLLLFKFSLSNCTAIFHCDQKGFQFLTKFLSCWSAQGQVSGPLSWSLFVLCVCVQEGDAVFLASDIRYLKELISFCHQVHCRRINGDGAKASNINFLPVSVFSHFLKHF